jgi:hypothetical protein
MISHLLNEKGTEEFQEVLLGDPNSNVGQLLNRKFERDPEPNTDFENHIERQLIN